MLFIMHQILLTILESRSKKSSKKVILYISFSKNNNVSCASEKKSDPRMNEGVVMLLFSKLKFDSKLNIDNLNIGQFNNIFCKTISHLGG